MKLGVWVNWRWVRKKVGSARKWSFVLDGTDADDPH